MPDIDFQRIELNLIPKKGDEPVVFYASQYESARRFIADLMWGDTEFAPGDDCWAEIDIRKNDDNIVVITHDVTIDNNEVSVILPVQALTCIGKNLGQVKIYAADDQLIAALNFIIEVQADPLAGGVKSKTAIDNLTSQIEAIAQEVIGEDYYDKTEVDALLNDKADVSDLPDMSLYYTKTATDTLLNAKADKTDTYTKAQVDSALALKANTADLATVATSGDYNDLLNKPVLPDMTQYYTKSEVDNLIDNIYPTLTASGEIATFSTALTKPLVSVSAEPLATTITRCGVNLLDSTAIAPFNANCTVTKTDNLVTVVNNNGYAVNFFTGVDVLLVAGTYRISIKENSTLQIGIYKKVGGSYQYLADGITVGSRTATFTLTQTEIIRPQCNIGANSTYSLDEIQITKGITELPFEPYNGQTVPVADATTLITLSGVNNVFADIGSVTVQYKYMSM